MGDLLVTNLRVGMLADAIYLVFSYASPASTMAINQTDF